MSFEFQLSSYLSFSLFSLCHFRFYSFFFSYSPVKYFMATLVGFLISSHLHIYLSIYLIFPLSFPHLVSLRLVFYFSFIYLLFLLISSDYNIITHFFSLYICHSKTSNLFQYNSLFLFFYIFHRKCSQPL